MGKYYKCRPRQNPPKSYSWAPPTTAATWQPSATSLPWQPSATVSWSATAGPPSLTATSGGSVVPTAASAPIASGTSGATTVGQTTLGLASSTQVSAQPTLSPSTISSITQVIQLASSTPPQVTPTSSVGANGTAANGTVFTASSGPPPLTIILSSVGGALVLALVAIGSILFVRRRRKKQQTQSVRFEPGYPPFTNPYKSVGRVDENTGNGYRSSSAPRLNEVVQDYRYSLYSAVNNAGAGAAMVATTSSGAAAGASSSFSSSSPMSSSPSSSQNPWQKSPQNISIPIKTEIPGKIGTPVSRPKNSSPLAGNSSPLTKFSRPPPATSSLAVAGSSGQGSSRNSFTSPFRVRPGSGANTRVDETDIMDVMMQDNSRSGQVVVQETVMYSTQTEQSRLQTDQSRLQTKDAASTVSFLKEDVQSSVVAESLVSQTTAESQVRMYTAVSGWIPQAFDELKVFPGDAIQVIYVYDDGWCIGKNVRSGEEGVFPMACVSDQRGGSQAGSISDIRSSISSRSHSISRKT
ncbi:uncharacterized protein BJ171DRAFT_497887 [Polychytrium aggregatum]|uniref:uncharacterized protein n=1 Tax=Polychytrium aggregatum TaxID=110093 RepID=UPI0022FE0F8C|nr:uncharacterized protein BJ171DRAFT_497887 [Polychytrium aggregatum]KAI9206457.1 hypothetical protein BJ171DRAFT_497887 [Polychytrium aggregatum]